MFVNLHSKTDDDYFLFLRKFALLQAINNVDLNFLIVIVSGHHVLRVYPENILYEDVNRKTIEIP